MTARKLTACGLMIALSSVLWSLGFAQDYQVERDPEARVRPQAHYRVRVVNKMGIPICAKIMAYGKSGYFHADLDPNESEVEDLWAGQRALCVWDDRTGELLIVARVHINQNGVLRIRPLWDETEKPGAPAESTQRTAPAAASPSFQIESE